MGAAMATGTRSEATAAPAAAQPERKGARASSSSGALPDAVLQIQRTAGNAAVARMVGRPATRALQRCGANCGCSTCSTGHGAEEEMLDEQFGLLRTAVARRSA